MNRRADEVAWVSDAKNYFAYGSNMSTDRLRARIPRATPIGPARWPGMRLAFNKVGQDGSGKANLVEDPAAEAWGVLFSIPHIDWPSLDGFEPGYVRAECAVLLETGENTAAHVYLGVGGICETTPHGWYRDHLHRGAVEHGLPDEIVRLILSLQLD
jgi:gamma-glutamylcyclotransferase